MKSHNSTTVFYDGNCPLCCRQMKAFKKRDKKRQLHFINIHAPDFFPEKYNLPPEDIVQEIHAILPDGRTVKAMEAIRAVYTQLGLGWLIKPTRLPFLRFIFDKIYGWIAKNRNRIPARKKEADTP